MSYAFDGINYTQIVTMSGSQLDAFFTTPFQLIPAPGANKVVMLRRIQSIFIQTGANFYGQDSGVEMCWNNTPMTDPPDTATTNPNSTTAGSPIYTVWDAWGRLGIAAFDISVGVNQPIKVKSNFDWNQVGQIVTGHIVAPGSTYTTGVTTLGGTTNLTLNIASVDGGGGILTVDTFVDTPGVLPAVGAVFNVDGGDGLATFHVDSIQPGTSGTFRLTLEYQVLSTV